jgi:hypothetical protein
MLVSASRIALIALYVAGFIATHPKRKLNHQKDCNRRGMKRTGNRLGCAGRERGKAEPEQKMGRTILDDWKPRAMAIKCPISRSPGVHQHGSGNGDH